MIKTIQDFQIDSENKCQHLRQKASKGFDNLSIAFCTDCGTNIITYYKDNNNNEDKIVYFVSPYDAWKLFNGYFGVMKWKQFNRNQNVGYIDTPFGGMEFSAVYPHDKF